MRTFGPACSCSVCDYFTKAEECKNVGHCRAVTVQITAGSVRHQVSACLRGAVHLILSALKTQCAAEHPAVWCLVKHVSLPAPPPPLPLAFALRFDCSKKPLPHVKNTYVHTHTHRLDAAPNQKLGKCLHCLIRAAAVCTTREKDV